MKKWLELLVSIVLCNAVGALGGWVTLGEIGTWYATLSKPWFQPPNWVFGPVWTTLYTLMGIVLFLLVRANTEGKKIAYIAFTIQLILNLLWSIVFFGLHSIVGGVFVIIPLWLFIFAWMILTYRHTRLGAWLVLPYILWVSFATVLNLALLMIN